MPAATLRLPPFRWVRRGDGDGKGDREREKRESKVKYGVEWGQGT